MKYSTEAKSMLEGYLEQAQITVKKEDKEFLADMISKEYEGSKLTNAECDKVVKTLETYGIAEIWSELKDQILKDISGYVDDMSNPENFSNKKNFGRVKDLLITVSDILKNADFFTEDKKLYEDIESGKLFEELDIKDVDMSNPKEIAKFIVKNVPDPKNKDEHKDDEEFIKVIDEMKDFSNTSDSHEIVDLEAHVNGKDLLVTHWSDKEDAYYVMIDDYNVQENFKTFEEAESYLKKEFGDFINQKNFSFDAKAGAERLESITGIKNWEYAGDKFVTPDGLYTLGNEAEEGNEPIEYIYTSNGSEVKVLGEIKDNKYEVYKEPIKLGDKQNFSNKNFGNPVSGKLPAKIDSFLQDLAQMHGKFGYGEIMKFEPDEAKIKELNKLYKQYVEAAEVDDEHEMEEIARNVADIIGAKASKNFSNIHLPVRSRRNFSHKNFNDEHYPDEKEPTTKVNFDGTKLPVRARFTMQNPRY